MKNLAHTIDVSFREKDAEEVRDDFPIFKRLIKGKPLIYLDSAATSQKPETVIEELNKFYLYYNSNVHRGVYTLSEEATEMFENTRSEIKEFINAKSDEEVIFVKNATEGINLVAKTWGRQNLKKGDVILLTEMEHHSNLIPWQILSKETGARLVFIEIDADGKLEIDKIESLFKNNPVKILALTHVSNVLGTINPVEEITGIAHRFGAIVLVDGAQSAPHQPIDVQAIGCDFFVFSSHKMLGPTGVGILYGRKNLLMSMDPFLTGGEMIKDVNFSDAVWNDLPWKFEAGTPPVAEAVAFGKAIEYLKNTDMEWIKNHEKYLVHYAYDQLQGIPGIEIYGPPPDERSGLISFNLKGVHPHDVAAVLDTHGIAVRAGHHCAKPLHIKLGLEASVRTSFYLYNIVSEVDKLVDGIYSVKKIFKK